MKIEIETKGRVGIRQKKCFKKNCERKNDTLEDTEDQCSSISNELKARERQRGEEKVGRK